MARARAMPIWLSCKSVRGLHVGPWVVAGQDFILLVNPEDKSNDAINRCMMVRFRSRLNRLELKEVYLNGCRYMWSNERAIPTLEKIDHIFSMVDWEGIYPSYFISALGTVVSDHCPLLLDLDSVLGVGRRFQFEAFWTKADGFMDVVVEAWASVPTVGNPFQVLDNKLRATVRALTIWNDCWIGNVKLQIAISLEIIHMIDVAAESRPLSGEEGGVVQAFEA